MATMVARNLTPDDAPNLEVLGSRYAGQRCRHGQLLVEVTFAYDAQV
jgi:hypothetical protein